MVKKGSITLPMSLNSSQVVSTSVKQYSYCPFDHNHIIQSSKLLKHIKKCRSPTRRDYVECPYSPYHWLNFHEIEEHKLECPQSLGYPVEGPSVIPLTEAIKHPCMAGNSSFLSQISRIQLDEGESYYSDIINIAQDFKKLKATQQHHFNKKFNNVECRALNQKHAQYREPNFAEWFDRHYDKADNQYYEKPNRNDPFFDDYDF